MPVTISDNMLDTLVNDQNLTVYVLGGEEGKATARSPMKMTVTDKDGGLIFTAIKINKEWKQDEQDGEWQKTS
ncbi:hypothetical protein [Komagataeibacter europaeus]|uniref:hypothetical protein n=1 Tax=Komagataeibacter europaeus TaxID=33995 RepID=UPI0012FB7AF3|nr:hypothetical protein [Komagataeibacter europaeus]